MRTTFVFLLFLRTINVLAQRSTVQGMAYVNAAASGVYQMPTSFKVGSGDKECETVPHSYSGSLGPFSEEVAFKFRGPLILDKFAAYVPGQNKGKRDSQEAPASQQRRHRHDHRRNNAHDSLHKRQSSLQKRDTVLVTATMNGESWVMTMVDGQFISSEPTTSAAVAIPAVQGTAATSISVVPDVRVAAVSKSQAAPAVQSYTSPSTDGGASTWQRTAFYDSQPGTAKGLTFLTNYGLGWSQAWGNAQGYMTSDAEAACSSAEVLGKNVTIPDEREVTILTSQICNDDCDLTNPADGAVAYHGFNGAEKAFFFRFQMPYVTPTDSKLSNMPAIWLLNANLVNLVQYGGDTCSCWTSGCGELDIFEVIPGDYNSAVTQIHMSPDSNLNTGVDGVFARPFNEFITVALIMSDSSIRIQVVEDHDWSEDSLSQSEISSISAMTSANINSISQIKDCA